MRLNVVEVVKGCAKGLLLILNAFCMLLAIVTFAGAVVDTRILKQYGEELATGTFAGNMTIIAVCLLLNGIAVLGCVGLFKENIKLLYSYIGLLMILVVLEVLVGIFVAVQRCGLQLRVTDWLREDFFRNVTDDKLLAHNKEWDEIQISYECCGLNGPEDYIALHQPISMSCCPRAYRARSAHAQQQLYKACISGEHYYSEGCEEEIIDILRADADWLMGVAVVSFWLEAAGMVLAACVASNLKNSVVVYKDTVKY